MSRHAKYVLVILASLGSSACSTSGLRDQLEKSEYTLTFDDRLRKQINAPIIVQGKVLRVEEIGRPRLSSGDRRIATQLTRITIAREFVVKGDLPQEPIEFYFFQFLNRGSEVDFGRIRYIPAVGQRRVYFLRKDGEVLRIIGDVADYTLGVSGGPPQHDICKSLTPGCCLSQLLMTPGVTPDPDTFAHDLGTSVAVTEILCSTPLAESLLSKLVHSPNPQIANEARELIRSREYASSHP